MCFAELLWVKPKTFLYSEICDLTQISGFSWISFSIKNVKPLRRSTYYISSLHRKKWEGWNINQLSFSCGFRHRLRVASPSADFRCGGNLGFAGSAIFTHFAITHANILSSMRSTPPHGWCFAAHRMLSYHPSLEASDGKPHQHQTTDFEENIRIAWRRMSPSVALYYTERRRATCHTKSPAKDPRLRYYAWAPINFRRHDPRIVSCYTLFKGWLPLSQPPIC